MTGEAVVAAVSAAIAVVSIFVAVRSSGTAHMHGLFREYLSRRLDILVVNNPSEELLDVFVTFKLYVMEEVYLWASHWWPKFVQFGQMDQNWIATIETHLKTDRERTLRSLTGGRASYDANFYEFAHRILTGEATK